MLEGNNTTHLIKIWYCKLFVTVISVCERKSSDRTISKLITDSGEKSHSLTQLTEGTQPEIFGAREVNILFATGWWNNVRALSSPLTHCLPRDLVLIWHDDVIKWKHFPRYWPFVWGIHRWPVNSPHKGQWRGALIFSLIWAWTNTQTWGWWFVTPLHPIWRHDNEICNFEIKFWWLISCAFQMKLPPGE